MSWPRRNVAASSPGTARCSTHSNATRPFTPAWSGWWVMRCHPGRSTSPRITPIASVTWSIPISSRSPRSGSMVPTGRWGCAGTSTRNGTDGATAPSAVFASPDRFENQRAHLMGLFLPTVPEFVAVNAREARDKPLVLEPGKSIRLEARIYADADASDALAVIDQWKRLHGFPQPAPLPRGSYEREIAFSMQAYLKSLWIPETKEWWASKGGGMMSTKERSSMFVAQLLLGALLSPDAEIRRQCRERAELVLPLVGGEPRPGRAAVPGAT